MSKSMILNWIMSVLNSMECFSNIQIENILARKIYRDPTLQPKHTRDIKHLFSLHISLWINKMGKLRRNIFSTHSCFEVFENTNKSRLGIMQCWIKVRAGASQAPVNMSLMVQDWSSSTASLTGAEYPWNCGWMTLPSVVADGAQKPTAPTAIAILERIWCNCCLF